MTPLRLLAVDDDPVFLTLMEHVLTRLGYADNVCVASGDEALQLLRDPAQQFDCLLLDIEMPGMDGIELCERLRTLPRYRHTPVLMVTAMKTIHHVEAAFRAGATDYVHKPIDQLEMKSRLRVVGDLVAERRRRSQAESQLSTDFGLPTLRITFDEPFAISEAGSVVQYLALENYALTLSRLHLVRHTAMAFKVTNAELIFRLVDAVDFVDTMANVAAAIGHSLKEVNHLIAYAGEGEFVALITERVDPDILLQEARIGAYLERYADLYSALDLDLPQVRVGRAQHCGLFRRNTAPQLIRAARRDVQDRRLSEQVILRGQFD